MANTGFMSLDTFKISKFESESAEAIKEFSEIRREFEAINTTLLNQWQGKGADAYQKETDHILENIGGIKDVLDSINDSVVKDIRECFQQLDDELGEYNRNPQTDENDRD